MKTVNVSISSETLVPTMHPNSTIPPGTIVDNRYRVERTLGVGGMGVVVAAVHVDLHERRALKVMHAGLSDKPNLVERFLREARAAARLRSSHVVRVSDVARLVTGEPYIVMEYLDGVDLAGLLKTRTRVSPQEAVSFVIQAAEAIAEAHGAGIVHRDLKPGNLFLTHEPPGHIKVLDFGISKVTDDSGGEAADDLTSTTEVIGSPSYMAPEQIRSLRDVDRRADIWALGVILYELTTGVRPFRGPTMADVCSNVLTREPDPPSTLAPGIPAALDALVAECMRKDREQRLGDARELLAALKTIEKGWSTTEKPPITAPLANTAARPEATQVLSRAWGGAAQVVDPVSVAWPEASSPTPSDSTRHETTAQPETPPVSAGTYTSTSTLQNEAQSSSIAAPAPIAAPSSHPNGALGITTSAMWGTTKTGHVTSAPRPPWTRLRRVGIASSVLVVAAAAYLGLSRQASSPTATSVLAATASNVPGSVLPSEPTTAPSAEQPLSDASPAPEVSSMPAPSASPSNATVAPPRPTQGGSTAKPKSPASPKARAAIPPASSTPKSTPTDDAFGRQWK